MDSYGYHYPPSYPPMASEAAYLDHGDGFKEYYGLEPLDEESRDRQSRSKHHIRKGKESKRSPSIEVQSPSKSKTRTRLRSRSRSRSRSRTQSRNRSRSRTASRHRDLSLREPSFLDAFRVLYLTPSKHKKSTTMYLATKKRQDRVQELLESDGLGSKRWLFYPRSKNHEPTAANEVAGSRDNVDQRVKIDGDFFRKYKKSKKVDPDAPIAKLKRWELVLYKKLGFIQAV